MLLLLLILELVLVMQLFSPADGNVEHGLHFGVDVVMWMATKAVKR